MLRLNEKIFMKHEKKIMFIFFGIFIFLAHSPLFLKNLLPSFRIGHDLGTLVYPLFHNYCAIIKNGEIPLWSNSLFCGFPIYCCGYFSVFNPILYLARFLEPITVYKIYLWFIWTAAGFFMYIFLRRRLRISIVPAIIGGLWYALMPLFTAQLLMWFYYFHFGIPAFFPIILFYFTGVIDHGLSAEEGSKSKNIIFCAFWITVATIFGGTYYFYLLFLALFCYFLVAETRNLFTRRFDLVRKQSLYLLMIVFLALGLVAFQLLPFLQYLILSGSSRPSLNVYLGNLLVYFLNSLKSLNPPVRANIYVVTAFPAVFLLFTFLFFKLKNRVVSNFYFILYGFIGLGCIGLFIYNINIASWLGVVTRKINFQYLLFLIDFAAVVVAAWHIDNIYFRSDPFLWNKISKLGYKVTKAALVGIAAYYFALLLFILVIFGITGLEKGKLFLSPEIPLTTEVRIFFPKSVLFNLLFFIKEKILMLNYQFAAMKFVYPVPFLLLLGTQIILLISIVWIKSGKVVKEAKAKTSFIFLLFFFISAIGFQLYWYGDSYNFLYHWYKETNEVKLAKSLLPTERIVFFESNDIRSTKEKYKTLIKKEEMGVEKSQGKFKFQKHADIKAIVSENPNVPFNGVLALRQLAPLVNGLRFPNGYINLLPDRVAIFLTYVEFEDIFLYPGNDYLIDFGRQSQFSNLNSKFFDFLGCRLIFLSPFMSETEVREKYDPGLGFSTYLVGSELDASSKEKIDKYLVLPFRVSENRIFKNKPEFNVCFENPRAYPKAWVVYSVVFETDEKSILIKMLDPQFDLSKVAVVEDRSAVLAMPIDKASKIRNNVQISNYKNNSFQIQVASDSPGLLVTNDCHYPGWKAFIDGKQTRILISDYMFRSILIPAGERINIKMVFDPSIFKIGLLISAGFLLFTVLFLQRLKR